MATRRPRWTVCCRRSPDAVELLDWAYLAQSPGFLGGQAAVASSGKAPWWAVSLLIVAVFGALGLWLRSMARAKPRAIDDFWVARVSYVFTAVITVMGGLMVWGSVITWSPLLTPSLDQLWSPGYGMALGIFLICFVFGLLFFTIGLSILFLDYSIKWDNDELSGPSSLYPFPFGPRRKALFFSNIARAGGGADSEIKVSDAFDTKIILTSFHVGNGAVREKIRSDLIHRKK